MPLRRILKPDAAAPDAAPDVADAAWEAPAAIAELMGGMAGITSGLDAQDRLVRTRRMRHDGGIGLVRGLGLDEVRHFGAEVDDRELHVALGIRHGSVGSYSTWPWAGPSTIDLTWTP